MNIRHANEFSKPIPRKVRGFTLVELMVAMLLGLIVIAGVSSVFLANLRSYRTNTALSDVQSNARIAFELMARDIRQAGLTGCNSVGGRLANVLTNGPHGSGTQVWWANWANSVQGYAPGATDPAITGAMPARAASTDSLALMSVAGEGLSVNTDNQTSATMTLNNTSSDLEAGDIAVVCDPDHATMLQVTSYASGTPVTLQYASGTGSPGNCTTGLGFPTSCSGSGIPYTFGMNSKLSKVDAHDWYIGTNPVGGYSLYRVGLSLVGGAPTPTAQEMVRNVTNMQITYHQSGDADFVAASAVANWGSVDAVHIVFTLQSTDQRAGTDTRALTRTFASTTTIRNRT